MTLEKTDAPQTVYTADLETRAEQVLKAAFRRYSRVFERGFATYCDEAKAEALGASAPLIANRGAVSP